jgi:hypothetical protein
MAEASEIRKIFVGPVMACFRKPNDTEADVRLFIQALTSALEMFPTEVIADAGTEIIRTRKDPFMPTVAECIEACRTVTRRLKAADGQKALQEALDIARSERGRLVAGSSGTAFSNPTDGQLY